MCACSVFFLFLAGSVRLALDVHYVSSRLNSKLVCSFQLFSTLFNMQPGRNTYNFRGRFPFLHDQDPLVTTANRFGLCVRFSPAHANVVSTTLSVCVGTPKFINNTHVMNFSSHAPGAPHAYTGLPYEWSFRSPKQRTNLRMRMHFLFTYRHK